MKKTIVLTTAVLLFVAVCLCLGPAFAAEKELSYGRHGKVWKWDKPFSEDVEDAIIETKTVRKSALNNENSGTAEERIEYPKAVITKKGLRFFDENMKQRKYLKYSKLGPSDWDKNAGRSKRHIGVLVNKLVHHSMKGRSQAMFKAFDTDGNELWEIDISSVGYGMPSISPDGKYIVCTGDPTLDVTGFMPSIWDKSGMVKRLFNDQGQRKSVGRVRCISFDASGDYFTLVRMQSSYDPGACSLVKYDRSGNVAWEKKIDGEQIQQSELSDSGNYDLCVTTKLIEEETGESVTVRGMTIKKKRLVAVQYHVKMFDKDGRELWSKGMIPGNHSIVFSPDENKVMVSTVRHDFTFDTKTGAEAKW